MPPSNSYSILRRDWVTDLACLGFFILLFYLLWLGSYPLFTPDEGRYSEVAREMVASGDFITPRVNGVAFLDKPALYYWLQAIMIGLFGIQEWALRFFPALLGVMGCLSTYVAGRRLFDRRTGLLSAIILATTPLYFGGAHYANLDLEVAVWISCSLLSFLCGIENQDKSRPYFFLAAYLFAAFAALTKGLIGAAFPAMIIGTWIAVMGRWDLILRAHLCKGILIFAIIVLPWYLLVQKANPEFLHYFFVVQQFTRFVSGAEFNNPTPFWFYFPILILGCFPWTVFLPQMLYHYTREVCRDRKNHPSELFLLLWVAIVFLFFSIPHSKTVSYIFPVLPPLALLLGHYLSGHWENARNTRIRLGGVNFCIIGILLGAALIAQLHYHRFDLLSSTSSLLIRLAYLLAASALCMALLSRRHKLLPLFTTYVACSVVLLLVLTANARYLNQNSAKNLVAELKTLRQPQDEVISYFKYYHDVPIYLGERVTVAADWHAADMESRDNWRRELWYGMAFQKTDKWLIDEDQFWQRWNSNKRVFVFINDNYLDQFKKRAQIYYHLGKEHDIILMSNRITSHS